MNSITLDQGIFDFAIDINEGSYQQRQAAISGDLNALLSLTIMSVSMVLSAGTIAAYSSATSGFWATVGAVGSIFSIYSTASGLAQAGTMSRKDLYMISRRQEELMSNAHSLYMSDSLTYQKSKWMAGGEYYNEVYAGGELFNITGSRNQNRMLGKPDDNFNKRLGRIFGNDHDFHRMTKSSKVGTENFSVFIFGKK